MIDLSLWEEDSTKASTKDLHLPTLVLVEVLLWVEEWEEAHLSKLATQELRCQMASAMEEVLQVTHLFPTTLSLTHKDLHQATTSLRMHL